MKRTAICALLALNVGCAASYRTLGMQDPSVEIARAMSATQTASIQALTEALSKITACGGSK